MRGPLNRGPLKIPMTIYPATLPSDRRTPAVAGEKPVRGVAAGRVECVWPVQVRQAKGGGELPALPQDDGPRGEHPGHADGRLLGPLCATLTHTHTPTRAARKAPIGRSVGRSVGCMGCALPPSPSPLRLSWVQQGSS